MYIQLQSLRHTVDISGMFFPPSLPVSLCFTNPSLCLCLPIPVINSRKQIEIEKKEDEDTV